MEFDRKREASRLEFLRASFFDDDLASAVLSGLSYGAGMGMCAWERRTCDAVLLF